MLWGSTWFNFLLSRNQIIQFERSFIIYMLLNSPLNTKTSAELKILTPKPLDKVIPPKGEIGHLLQWRDTLPFQSPTPAQGSSKTLEVTDIQEQSLDEFGSNIQALYLNIDWSTFTIEKFKKLEISNELLSNGMVFVWAEKELMDQVMTHLEQFDINYVQIFTIAFLSLQKIQSLDVVKPKGTLMNFFQAKTPAKCKQIETYLNMEAHEFPSLRVDEVIIRDNSQQMFQKSKRNLLLLRKVNKKESLELRHQRTSDVFFGLYDEEKGEMDTKVEQCVYEMIETLLIKANYVEGEPLKMMELWAKPGAQREGWISVSEKR